MSASRLGALVCATISTPNLRESVAAYHRFLGYETRHEGGLPEDVANALAGPAAAGAPMAVLGPASGALPTIRLIEAPLAPTFVPARTFGWSALEIMAQDVDALQRELAGSPFEVVGEARDLDFAKGALRAMQARGPGGEILVFTQVNRPLPGYDLPVATSKVDRIFAAIQGCPELDRTRDFFAHKFFAEAGPELEAALVTVNDAFGLDRPEKHRITTIALPAQGFIELDQYPDEAVRRQPVPGYPMPGITAVAFEVDSVDNFQLYWLGEILSRPEPPYLGRRHVTFYGGSGELIELIERS
jgi:catechol 2,3-dioxygenase-like lactoylglutathione lyase family enzyme